MFLPKQFLQGFFQQLYIAKTKHYLKMGWCNMYPRL